MSGEKRSHQKPVPDNLEEIISLEQLATIHKLESFGWELFFVRRSTPKEIIPIMRCPITSECYTAVIDKKGFVVRDHDLIIRQDDRRLH